ncbi:hypothetical protein [Halolamina sp. C58]|uniref:hypothetical protein n=1 Tax=Halolamina sp. C58 TaxID=3421640 RepID=UPI003EB70537
MNRRKYLKAIAAVPLTPSIPEFDGQDTEDEEWTVRGVWRRKDDTGYLHDRNEGVEAEFEHYNEWVSPTIEALDGGNIVNLFDYRLISIYNGSYSRTHFAHDNGLEVTIKREPEEEVEWTAYVTHVDELWEDHREYASSSQVRIAQKLKQVKDNYNE